MSRLKYQAMSTSYLMRIQFRKGSTANVLLNGIVVFSVTEEFSKPLLIERSLVLNASNQISVQVLVIWTNRVWQARAGRDTEL